MTIKHSLIDAVGTKLTIKITDERGDFEYRLTSKTGGMGISSNNLFKDNVKVEEPGFITGIGGRANVARFFNNSNELNDWLKSVIAQFLGNLKGEAAALAVGPANLEDHDMKVKAAKEALAACIADRDAFIKENEETLLSEEEELLQKLAAIKAIKAAKTK